MEFTFNEKALPCCRRIVKQICRVPGTALRRLDPAQKRRIIMRINLTIAICTAVCLHISARALSQSVTISGKDIRLETVFQQVEKQTGYFFLYKYQDIRESNPLTIDLRDVPLAKALDECLKGQQLTWSIQSRTIVIVKIAPAISAAKPPAPVDIIGRVTNKAGQPLNGATVIIKRTQQGILTDPNGSFTIRAVLPSDTLVVSYLGYQRQFIRVGETKDFKIVLSETSNKLDEVVVQAYGETSQRLTTGNIGTVTAAQIEKQPVMNPLEALQGQVPGVVVTSTSGYASGAIKVEIRGRNTINPNFPSDPLSIIDGVPLTILDLTGQSNYNVGSQGMIQSGILSPANGQSPFFSINAADIENISVLKDADATAIYGSRGANGVILITTKKGKAGKTHADFAVYTGYSQVPSHVEMLNTQQYVDMREEALRNNGLPLNINTAPDLVAWGTNRYTNWEDKLWGGVGKTTDAQASISGGDATTTFRLGAGYHYLTEILTYNGANERGNMSVNINHNSLNQRLRLSFSGTYSVTSSDMIYTPNAIALPPNAPPIFDSNGNLNFAGWAPLSNKFPFGSILQPYTAATNFLNSNLNISYELIKGLVLRSSFGYNNSQADQTSLEPIASQNPANNPKGSANFGYTYSHNLVVEPQIEYSSYFGKGKLNILGGASAQANTTSSVELVGNGYTNDALLTSVANAPYTYSNNTSAQYKYEALYGRVNYNWVNKYILNLNMRRDGSSNFGPGRQFGTFGSVGGAWIFSEESWLKKNVPGLSFGKLRGSYGTTGNDQIGQYAFLSQWSYGQFPYGASRPLIPLGHTDSTLHWEVNRKLEAAIDLGFFEDRLTLEASWYRNRCDDQLVAFPTPYLTGFNMVTSNSPADVENKGWEFVLNGKVIDGGNFKWSARFNIGINRNKLIAYPNLSQSPYADQYIIGQSLQVVKLLHYTGIDPQTGLYTFEDKNHDGKITIDRTDRTSDDRYDIDVTPKFDGGFTNNFNYKQWQLSLFFYFKKQLGLSPYSNLLVAGGESNQPVGILSRWQEPGDITNTALFTTKTGVAYTNYKQNSDAILTDASYIRLQNLSLSYTVPENISKKIGISNSKIYVRAENLFLITKYPGLDPEVQSFGALPKARVITAGMSVNF